MQIEVIEDAYVLTPNKEHQNFTRTEKLIGKGTILDGEPKTIIGKRRGENFNYKLFLTKDKEFIHLKKTNPMRTTEVTLGADASQTPTVVSVPTGKKLFTPMIIGGTLIGAGAGYYYAKKKNADTKKRNMYIVVGAVIGFFGAKYFEKRKGIVVKPSK
jgi:F0F1-type ATP synthase assembly protein I